MTVSNQNGVSEYFASVCFYKHVHCTLYMACTAWLTAQYISEVAKSILSVSVSGYGRQKNFALFLHHRGCCRVQQLAQASAGGAEQHN